MIIHCKIFFFFQNLNNDPMSPRVEVRAFAGPMNKSQAVEFRRKWKTPPRLTPKKGQGDASNVMNSPSLALRLEDTEKGLERVGRYIYVKCKLYVINIDIIMLTKYLISNMKLINESYMEITVIRTINNYDILFLVFLYLSIFLFY